MLEIRKADLSRLENGRTVAALLDEYARDPMGAGEPLAEHVREGLPAALAGRAGAHALIAWLDGQPAGMALCFEGFSSFACKPLLNIHDFMVRDACRGQGIGRALMGAVDELARGLGCCKVTLEVLEGNHPAQALYRSVGYEGYALRDETGRAMFWQKPL